MHSRNRTAVHLQTVRKEREIKRAIKEMLRSRVIEYSEAVYYSYPVIVHKTEKLYRCCIDYRNLNKYTEASSTLSRLFVLYSKESDIIKPIHSELYT